MKLSFDPSATAPRNITAESVALATWYDAHPAIRRLWGIRDTQRLRVIVSVEPTHDDSDIFPVWIGNSAAWAQELRLFTGTSVQLELIDEPSDGIEIDAGSNVVADLFWRDPTILQPNLMV